MTLIVKNQYVVSGLTGDIIGAAMEVHNQLGPGFLESVYDEALVVEFAQRKIKFERQKELPVYYKQHYVKKFVCDFVVDNKVIVEVKAISTLSEIDRVQLTSYLKASGTEIGLLLNFGGRSLEFKRMIYSKENRQNQCLSEMD
ncbi:MAG: GxxExxY protein [Phycisphaerae bacterium]|jgi:GxxExxY protein